MKKKVDDRGEKVMAALRRGEDPGSVARRYRVAPHMVTFFSRQVAAERKGVA